MALERLHGSCDDHVMSLKTMEVKLVNYTLLNNGGQNNSNLRNFENADMMISKLFQQSQATQKTSEMRAEIPGSIPRQKYPQNCI